MSTRPKPLPALCVSFDRQRYWLGLPRITQGLDHLNSSSLLGIDLAADRPGTGPGRDRHRRAGANRSRTGRPAEVGGLYYYDVLRR